MQVNERNTKQIDCPEHPQASHKAVLYTFGHQYAGIWECTVTAASDTCTHESTHIESRQVDYFPTPDIDSSYDVDVYVCDECQCDTDGSPAEDRADDIAEMQVMEELKK